MNYTKTAFTILTCLLIGLVLQSCNDNSNGFDFSNAPAPYDRSQAVSDSTLSEGVQLYVIEEGEGPFTVNKNDNISIRFTARLGNSDVFESTVRRSKNGIIVPKLTLGFLNGVQQFSPVRLIAQINAFRNTILGMKEGEKRSLVIKPSAGLRGRYSVTNTNLQGRTITIDFQLIRIF